MIKKDQEVQDIMMIIIIKDQEDQDIMIMMIMMIKD